MYINSLLLVVINGHIKENFILTSGLRQGDPLSPFLFLGCGEGLSSLMRLVLNGGFFHYVKISRIGLHVTHLSFADDCILFGKATRKGLLYLKTFYVNIDLVRASV